jgi:dihydrolipoamide dehydrogenase
MVVGDVTTGVEVVVVGGGPGGYVAAIRAARLGREVVLVDDSGRLGGICLNHGCIPSKALIHAAGTYHDLKEEAAGMGITAEGVTVDLKAMMAWKGSVVTRLTDGIAKLCRGNGIRVVHGAFAFTSERTGLINFEEGFENVEFEKAIIATGSRPAQLPGLDPDGESILTSRDALALEAVPERLLVVGGGYIGLELGTVYAKLGSRVEVVEMMDTLLPGVDPDLVRFVARRLKKLGVVTRLGTTVDGVAPGAAGGLEVTVMKGDAAETIACDKVLVAVGRRPNVAGLDLEKAGIPVDDRGFIPIDEECRTRVPHVFAIGDVAGEPMLAHKASREGIVAAEVLSGRKSARDWQAVPAVIFSDPEIATVGLSEEQAAAEGFEVQVGRFPFSASGRALTMNRAEGFVKVVADRGTGRVLGVRIVGPEASTMISEGALAIEMAATLEDIASTIHPHPTLPESLMEAAEAAEKKAIHILNPS